MKKIVNILLVSLTLMGLSTFTGCSDPGDPIDELSLDRVLAPLEFEMSMEANVNATFTWKAMSASKEYLIKLVREDGVTVYEERTLTYNAATAESPTMTTEFAELPASSKFTARLQALSSNERQADSKPVEIQFQTGIENLFLNNGIVADEDVTATTAIMRWKAGAVVTHLEVDNGVGKVALDATEIENGEYKLTGLTTGKTYVVQLYNEAKEAYRGTCTFVASDKVDVTVNDKTAASITLGWGADVTLTSVGIRLGSDESGAPAMTDLTPAQIAARSFSFEGLSAKTEYRVSAYNDGIECAALYVTTLGENTSWDFTTWTIAEWTTATTIADLTIMAATGKDMSVKLDTDYNYNYLDLRGKSTIKSTYDEAPTERALKFAVKGEGVVVIDSYANGAGRNFFAFVDVLGKSFGPVAAPVKADRGKIYIPCPGIPGAANVYIFTDATINHVYSMAWYEGAEAPGQHAEKLATPVVTATPAEITKGDATAVKFSWDAVANAATYDYKITYTLAADDSTVTLSDNITATEYTIPAATAATIKPGTYAFAVNALPATEYKYSKSSAGSANMVVNDTKLDAPVVTFTPASVTVGTSTAVEASWVAITDAVSYDVTFNGGAVETVTAATYTVPAATVAGLAVGSYTISVVANPASGSGAQASDAGTATLTVAEPSAGGTTTWNFSDSGFDSYYTAIGTTDNSSYSGTWNGLAITAGGKTLKVGTANSVDRYIQFGGAGTTADRVLSFTATASGKLTVIASNTGNSEALTRLVTISVDGQTQSAVGGVPSAGTPATCEFDITVSGPTTVYIYPTGGGLRFYSVEYTVSSTPDPVEWDFSSASFSSLVSELTAAGSNGLTNVDTTIDGLTILSGGSNLRGGAGYIQSGGAGSATKRVFSFTATGPGALKVVASNTGSSAATDGRAVTVQVGDDMAGAQSVEAGVAAGTPKDCEFTITATDGQTVYIYSTINGLRFYSIVYTPQ
ncbi:hypothetical protein [uncultured Alistipes sp.]|uniref:hypothetical protein n=1 Tax=uncultured Alistipes sp. TaxID=538949 RepID=UPI0025FA9267|nr:hypothetical protein [uncultured Alistipes sp.]